MTGIRSRAIRRGLMWGAAIVVWACGSATEVDQSGGDSIAAVVVSPSTSTVTIGAQVPLQAINLILVLPVIACIVVIFRSVVGIETFGTFAPVIVSLAFLMTGLTWGVAIFCVIVGLGVVLRSALQWFRIQLVARLAVLIALVSVMMAGLTIAGAYLGVGALLNVSIFPMVIMSNVIENFTTTQVELGTREAIRLTRNTLLVCAACYLTIEWTGLQSIVLSFPEVLIGVVALEIAIGKWRGLRLLEYLRFAELGRPAIAPAPPPSELGR